MDNEKIGNLIYKLRKENRMTQLQLAERLHISDKTVSKWERGLGCPDVSLLTDLSRVFGVDLEKLLRFCSLEDKELLGLFLTKTEYGFILAALRCLASGEPPPSKREAF